MTKIHFKVIHVIETLTVRFQYK